MLYEFALDPEVMTSWHTVRLIGNLVGIEHGRLISRFPRVWQRMVYEACGRRVELGDSEKKRIIEKIQELSSKMVSTGRPYDDKRLWLENAESEHTVRPFRAIIAANNPRNRDFILDADSFETIKLWDVPREASVPREARAMASCASLLFRVSRSILFVDPNFKPEAARFRRPLIEFLRVACDVAQLTGRPFDRIEYHLEEICDSSFFVGECRTSLLPQVPRGCEITFYRWREREPGESLHARYVLTDVGGLRFERGLDDGERGETTDVGPLGHDLYSERWKHFQLSTSAGTPTTYDLVDRIRVIGGSGVSLLP